MTRTRKRQIVVSIIFPVLALMLGGLAGYLLGCGLALHQAESLLAGAAVRMQVRAADFMTEAFQGLDQASAGLEAPCSDDELRQFRHIVLHAQYLIDAGRIRDGRVVCSAAQGQAKNSLVLPPLAFQENFQGNLYLHYNNFPPQEQGVDFTGIRRGDLFVVLSGFRYSNLVDPPMRTLRRIGKLNQRRIQQLAGNTLDLSRYPLDRDGTLWTSGMLLVTRCQTRLPRPSCSTVYEPVRFILAESRTQLWICSLAGAGVGLLCGLVTAMLFRRGLGMDRQLRLAIRRRRIRLLYQPIVDLATGKIVEAEALARWTDDDGFAVSPIVFVATAEQGGFVNELTALVISKTLRDLHPMLAANPEFRVNVNVSALDLASEDFLPMLERALQAAGVEPGNLGFEVTESSTAKGPEVRKTIHELRRRGHSVQIDDFGTGYSSLSYLHDLAVDAIKIDRAFTQSIGTEAVTRGILPQILAMARALNLQVVAEGIETAEQAAYFAGAEGGIKGQGWLFGRPMPAEILRERLEARSQTDAARGAA